MSDIWNWIKARLGEGSTWAGFAAIATGVASALAANPSALSTVGGAAVTLFGVIAAILKDKGATA
jgi:hypothetical protein